MVIGFLLAFAFFAWFGIRETIDSSSDEGPAALVIAAVLLLIGLYHI
jgi:hypothetical protein